MVTTENAVEIDPVTWETSGTGTFDDPNSPTAKYTPTNADIDLGQVILTVSANAEAPCTNPTDSKQFTLSFKAEPVIDLSLSPTTVCMGDDVILDAQITDFTTVAWSIVSGGGTLQIPNTDPPLKPTYRPDGSSDTVIIEIIAQPESPCSQEVSEQLTISVTQLPEILTFPTGPVESCALTPYVISGVTTNGEEDRVVWSSSGTGTFNLINPLNPTYTPSQADLDNFNGSVTLTMTAEAKDPCGVNEDVSQDLILNLKQIPVIDAGAEGTVCEGSDYTVSDATQTGASLPTTASISWSSNTNSGTFINGNTINPTYSPGPLDIQNGEFTLTLTVQGESPCGDVTDSKRVVIIKNPVVELNNTATTCANESYTIVPVDLSNYASLEWTSPGDGSFDSRFIEQPTYTPGTSDIENGVVLTLTALPIDPCANVNEASDQITLSFTKVPVVEAGPDVTVCEDDRTHLLLTRLKHLNTVQFSGLVARVLGQVPIRLHQHMSHLQPK